MKNITYSLCSIRTIKSFGTLILLLLNFNFGFAQYITVLYTPLSTTVTALPSDVVNVTFSTYYSETSLNYHYAGGMYLENMEVNYKYLFVDNSSGAKYEISGRGGYAINKEIYSWWQNTNKPKS